MMFRRILRRRTQQSTETVTMMTRNRKPPPPSSSSSSWNECHRWCPQSSLSSSSSSSRSSKCCGGGGAMPYTCMPTVTRFSVARRQRGDTEPECDLEIMATQLARSCGTPAGAGTLGRDGRDGTGSSPERTGTASGMRGARGGRSCPRRRSPPWGRPSWRRRFALGSVMATGSGTGTAMSVSMGWSRAGRSCRRSPSRLWWRRCPSCFRGLGGVPPRRRRWYGRGCGACRRRRWWWRPRWCALSARGCGTSMSEPSGTVGATAVASAAHWYVTTSAQVVLNASKLSFMAASRPC
mmetsp:Transcript_7472/g.10601  ORF Transcript_7472/g.10601 Transcript_7472/m.10601 type:complete len:294 (+) Transcript_7472:363-1244(+)